MAKKDKKVLIAFDDSDNALRAVQFVADSFDPGTKVTLFNVITNTASICDMDSPELIPYFKAQQSHFCLVEDKKKELVSEAMQKAKKILTKAGYSDKNITIKSQVKKKGIARDIAKEAGKDYDLIVIGRKGISGVKDFLFGSICQKVLTVAKDASILIVN
jgi:nucleotide-binding universal stress UspA family protein